MKDVDDRDLKKEIDQISRRIDEIVQQVEDLDPARKKEPDADQG